MVQSVYIGTDILWEAEWRDLWKAIPLEEHTIKTYTVEPKQEVGTGSGGLVGGRFFQPGAG
ncbi:MAG: hypothetical protein PVI99_08640 [Anaerolineales bacterium]|jgi:hypothetical protein